MVEIVQGRTTFPDAISNGGAIAAITIGTLIALFFLSLCILSVINHIRDHSQTATEEEEETVIALELSPQQAHPQMPPVAARYPSRHTTHVQDQNWSWETQTLA
jgi:hypothetical protein